jgi:hypothetical protein
MSGTAAVVMVPCGVPSLACPSRLPRSRYKGLITAFWFGEAPSVYIALPGRKPHTVADGLRWAVRELGLSGTVGVAERRGGTYLFREGGR